MFFVLKSTAERQKRKIDQLRQMQMTAQAKDLENKARIQDLENRLAHYVSQPPMICSFCGKEHTQVAKLIAGRTGFICDDCTRLAMDVLIEEGRK